MRRTVWLLLTLLFAMPALAETNEVRIAQQTSIAFLQFNVMKHQGLIEKHAKALGVPDVKVTFATFNGPDAMNDALLSGAVDIVSGGPPGLLVVWSKTWGSSQEVRGVGALAQLHFLLNTRNPNVKSIRDFTATDRIAMPAVKVAADRRSLVLTTATGGERQVALPVEVVGLLSADVGATATMVIRLQRVGSPSARVLGVV